MIRPPNLESMTVPCPECGADAKYIKPSLMEKITGKKKNKFSCNNFRCTKCKHEFMIVF